MRRFNPFRPNQATSKEATLISENSRLWGDFLRLDDARFATFQGSTMDVRSTVTGEDGRSSRPPGADFVPEAQMVERPPVKRMGAGSIPAGYAETGAA